MRKGDCWTNPKDCKPNVYPILPIGSHGSLGLEVMKDLSRELILSLKGTHDVVDQPIRKLVHESIYEKLIHTKELWYFVYQNMEEYEKRTSEN